LIEHDKSHAATERSCSIAAIAFRRQMVAPNDDRAGQGRRPVSDQAMRARHKFLKVFPEGFRDETYLDWERNGNGQPLRHAGSRLSKR
jgi:hypothetical protein